MQNCSPNLTTGEVMGPQGTTGESENRSSATSYKQPEGNERTKWPGSHALPVQQLLLLSDRGPGWWSPGRLEAAVSVGA